jgi:hypothetical protein
MYVHSTGVLVDSRVGRMPINDPAENEIQEQAAVDTSEAKGKQDD